MRCLLLVFRPNFTSLTSTDLLWSLRNMMCCSRTASARHAGGYIRRSRGASLAANKFPGSGRHLEMHVNQGTHPCRRTIVCEGCHTLSRIAVTRHDVPGVPIAGPSTRLREARQSAAPALAAPLCTTPIEGASIVATAHKQRVQAGRETPSKRPL
jgi:hypothetical protein